MPKTKTKTPPWLHLGSIILAEINFSYERFSFIEAISPKYKFKLKKKKHSSPGEIGEE